MKIIWHIVKKDFRRTRPWVILWWAVLGLVATYPTWGLELKLLYGRPEQDTVGLAYVLLDFLFVGGQAWVVIQALQADRPADDRAHWRVLPARRRDFLAAKALFVGLVCGVVPAVVFLGQRAAYGLPPGEWGSGMMGTLACQALIVAVAASVAVTFTHVLAGLVIIPGVLIFETILTNFLWTGYYPGGGAQIGWIPTELLATGIVLLTALVLVPRMYRCHRRSEGYILFSAGLLLVGPLLFLSDYTEYQRSALEQPAANNANAVAAFPTDPSVQAAISPIPASREAEPAAIEGIFANVTFSHLPIQAGETVLIHDQVSQSLTAINPSVPAWGYMRAVVTDGFRSLPGLRAALPYPQYHWLPDSSFSAGPNLDLFLLTPADIPARNLSRAPFLFFMAAGHFQVAEEMPLVKGAWAAQGPGAVGVLQMQGPAEGIRGAQVVLEVRQCFPYAGLTQRVWGDEASIYALVNPTRKEGYLEFNLDLVPPRFLTSNAWDWMNALGRDMNMRDDWRRFEFPGLGPDEVAAWLKDARLVRLQFVVRRRFTVAAMIPDGAKP